MIRGKDNVFEWLRFNKTSYWKVHNVQKSYQFGTSPMEENLSIDASISELGRLFEMLQQGQFLIEAWETIGQKKEWKKTQFTIENESAAVSGINQMPQTVDVQSQINEALEKYQAKQEMSQLQERIKTLEAEKKEIEEELNSAQLRIGQRLQPYIGSLMEALGFKTTASSVAGTDNQEKADEYQERLEKAFDLWSEHEADPVTMVEKIAKLAKTDQGTYNMARQILMGK